ncbi:MAG: response regulator [Desulfosarcinaceae bacterium]|jgi:CheY-like chemotaxis protein
MAKRLLVVDNEQDQLDIMREIISHLGVTVIVAEDGETALQKMASKPCQVVVTDLIMPDMEGTELCERLRNRYPDVVIFAFSGHMKLYDPDKLDRTGFDGYISKPIRIDTIAQAVENAFALAKRRRHARRG